MPGRRCLADDERGHFLVQGACITVSIGELLAAEASRMSGSALLQCDTSYVFKG